MGLRQVSIEDAKQIPIGWFEDDGLTPVTAETRQAVRDAARSLERQGFAYSGFGRRCSKKHDGYGGSFLCSAGRCFTANLSRDAKSI